MTVSPDASEGNRRTTRTTDVRMCLIGEILTDNMGYGESGWDSLFVESNSLINSNKTKFLDDKVQIRMHTDVCSFYLFPDSSDYPEKDPVVRYIQDLLGCNVRGMSVHCRVRKTIILTNYQ